MTTILTIITSAAVFISVISSFELDLYYTLAYWLITGLPYPYIFYCLQLNSSDEASIESKIIPEDEIKYYELRF